MIELAFIACLTADPAACENKSLVFLEMSPMTCMMRAQPTLAEWVETHPQWRIARWRCRQAPAERSI